MRSTSSPATILRSRRLGAMLAGALALSGCREATPVFLSELQAFGAKIDVSLVSVTREQAHQAARIVAQDFALLERDLTPNDSGSMARVNRLLATQESFIAPPSLLPLIRLCQRYEAESDGLFNPATGQLTKLWGFNREPPADHPPPRPESIARLVAAKPSMAEIEIDGLELRSRNPTLALDFGAIAKSYAIDLAVEHLIDLGVRNALVQAGGDLRAIGERSGQPWRVPIRRANGSGVLAMLSIRGDESMVTAAEYKRRFIDRGKTYHAILDPRTGWPADRARAVTVVHSEAATAAAAATALFIAGPDDWRSVAGRMRVRYALLVDKAGRVHMTQAMADRIELIDGDEEILVLDETTSRPLSAGAAL